MRRSTVWLVAVLTGTLTLLGMTAPAHAHDTEQPGLHVLAGESSVDAVAGEIDVALGVSADLLSSYTTDHELEPASGGDEDDDGSGLGWVVPVAMGLAAAGGLGFWLIKQREAAS